jgi:cytochrome c oxidase subunit 2
MISNLPLFPEQASTLAPEVDHLFFFLVGVSAFFSILIASLVVFFSIRYRRRSESELPRPIHGSLKLEVLWSVIPFCITMVMFFWGSSVYLNVSRPPDDALEVFVVGKQWMWKLQHMEGRREINELHVPVGRAVKLTMTSEDVIHSFYVPAFRIKADVVPGRYTTTWFEATKPGSYHLFCAEYCGTEHSRMIGRVVAMDRAAYEKWLAGVEAGIQPAAVRGASPERAGEELFTQLGCVACHRGQPGAPGPNLAGLFGKQVELSDGRTVVADEAYVRESIVNPLAKVVKGFAPVMPTFQTRVNEEQLFQLVQYVKSLRAEAAAADGGRGGL